MNPQNLLIMLSNLFKNGIITYALFMCVVSLAYHTDLVDLFKQQMSGTCTYFYTKEYN